MKRTEKKDKKGKKAKIALNDLEVGKVKVGVETDEGPRGGESTDKDHKIAVRIDPRIDPLRGRIPGR